MNPEPYTVTPKTALRQAQAVVNGVDWHWQKDPHAERNHQRFGTGPYIAMDALASRYRPTQPCPCRRPLPARKWIAMGADTKGIFVQRTQEGALHADESVNPNCPWCNGTGRIVGWKNLEPELIETRIAGRTVQLEGFDTRSFIEADGDPRLRDIYSPEQMHGSYQETTREWESLASAAYRLWKLSPGDTLAYCYDKAKREPRTRPRASILTAPDRFWRNPTLLEMLRDAEQTIFENTQRALSHEPRRRTK